MIYSECKNIAGKCLALSLNELRLVLPFMNGVRLLKPEEDAFGRALWAAFKGDEISHVVERDDGYLDVLSLKGYLSSYAEWRSIEQKAMECVKGKVLDIGCGAGRHSLYLQKRGLEVLGIDVSPLAIEICKQRGLKKAKVMAIEDVDFPPGSFGTIIMMGNNFGLFGSLKKARRLLKRFNRITSRDASIIVETRDPYKTENVAHLKYHELNRKRDRMGGQVRIRSRFRQYVGRWFDYLMVSKEEMKEILRGTRWRVKEFIDSGEPQYVAIIGKI
ncbi:MAG: class I SAM-dependent methyltransferase [Candidatus Bathyarchaeia archaeon]